MKKKTKFTLQPKLVIFLMTIVCIGMMVLSVAKPSYVEPVKNAGASIVVPIEEGVNHIGRAFTGVAENFQKVKKLKAENKRLKNQIRELQEDNSLLAQNKYELQRLRDLYELDEEYVQYEKIGARVIGKDTSNWFNTFTIDKGSSDGIAVDMNVISGGGLVGIITDVGKNYATVRTIIDDESSVSVSFASTSDTGIASGDLQLSEKGLMNLTGILKDATVAEGDMVVTSQISDKFLPGILVGFIEEVSLDSNQLNQSGTITPVVDFMHIDEVLVLKHIKDNKVPNEETTAVNENKKKSE
ncbi:MAG: rod shape-determining protein MreC [Lachnospiraceae bacterium]|nr:rod shape-determining protein MreC [Lachnospiraceae bacterium]